MVVSKGLSNNQAAVRRMNFRHGDKVWIKNLRLEGTVVEERTRSIVVRISREGELEDRHFPPEDLERLPTTKERYLENKTP